MSKKLWFVLVSACLVLSLARGDAYLSDTNDSISPYVSRGIGPLEVPADATNWGPSVQGIRLGIIATNTSFPIGSQSALVAVITNSSTNSVQVIGMGIDSAFYVSATNATGKSYHLTPSEFEGSRTSKTLNPRSEQAWEIAITFETNMEPGEYTVRCWGVFSTTNFYDLESNPLKFHVK